MLYSDLLDSLDPDEHLEHFGVKGMRWGSKRASNSNTESSSKQRTPMSRQTKKKVAAGVGAALVVGVLAGVAHKQLKEVKQNKALMAKNKTLVEDFFTSHPTTSFKDLEQSRADWGLPPIFR